MDIGGREKYWKELSIDEKIERLREQEKIVQGKFDELYTLIQRVVVEFEKHEHHDGKILIPIRIASLGYSGGLEAADQMIGEKIFKYKPENPDEVYF